MEAQRNPDNIRSFPRTVWDTIGDSLEDIHRFCGATLGMAAVFIETHNVIAQGRFERCYRVSVLVLARISHHC